MHVHKIILLFFLCFDCLVFNAQIKADSVYKADPRIQLHNLGAYTSLFVDSSNTITEKDIVSGVLDNKFQPLIEFTGEPKPYVTYWLQFSIAALDTFNNWWLMLSDSTHQIQSTTQNCYVDVFFVNQNNEIIGQQLTGFFVPRSKKTVKEHTGFNRVLFSAKQGETKKVYLKLYNEFDFTGTKITFPELRHPSLPLPEIPFNIILSVLCAIAAVFSVLSFFFYFFIREKAYLYFGFYTLLLSQHYLILHFDFPFIDLYIPENPHWAHPFFILLTCGGFLFFLRFGDAFINLRSLSAKTHKVLMWFLSIAAILTVLEFVVMGITHRFFLNPWLLYLILPVTLFFIIRFAFFKTTLARFYVIGAIWLFTFTILGILNESVIFLPFNPWPIGQVGQLLIYAAGLAYKVRLNEKRRAEAERIREMDEIKSKFFANISHEFRTPLTLIQGPLQQIEDQAGGMQNGLVQVPVRQVQTMRRNTDRLLELVNQLLDLSRLDAGKMKLQIVKGDVIQLLKSLTASFESLAERKQIHYHRFFPEQTLIAFFDKDKLEKIFTNLLGNAFKYTPEQGSISVKVECEQGRLRLLVEDTGPGMPKKELDKVFDRFYQVEGTEDKGTGIGLALVKELVDLYRGQISVSSEPGKGSSFKVSLPVEKNAFNENELVYGEWQSEKVFINTNDTTDTKSGTAHEVKDNKPLLLVVEDNADLRNFIIETVQASYNIVEAGNGKQGFEKALATIPDIIVSDVMMPVMDGFAMTGKIKKDERTSHIPVILLTAKAGQHHKIEGLETGADDYLTKPFDAKELLTRIDNLINQRKLLRKKFAGTIQLKPSEVAVKSIDDIFLQNVMKSIEKNMEEDEFGVEELAKEVTMSRSQLHRKLIALLDKSPSDLIRQTRLLRAKELLEKKAFTPSEVAFKVGFNSHTYFSKCFKEEFGISPSDLN